MNGICGGKCSFQAEDDWIMVVGGCSIGDGGVQLHEIGHFFGLYHTQGQSCGCCDTCSSPGDDQMPDTVPDMACWDQNAISMNWAGVPYSQLNAAGRDAIDNTFFNVMSYHNASNACNPHASAPSATNRLTESQLDRWFHDADEHRPAVRDGRTILMYPFATWPYDGSLAHPYNSVPQAMNESAFTANDIILFRPGAYDVGSSLILSSPMTLRVTRAGAATIGGHRRTNAL